MAFILHIDTSVTIASICLSFNENIIAYKENLETNTQAAFLQPTIKEICDENSFNLKQLDAIAVTIGPGSYTGLRVGLASAKGLCFALNKPLITLNTLQVMANAAVEDAANNIETEDLICPMVDARRMEVYTSTFNKKLQEGLTTNAVVLTEDFLQNELSNTRIHFLGNGSEKFKKIICTTNAVFATTKFSTKNMISLSIQCFNNNTFNNIIYSKPNYGKEFYTTQKLV